MARAYTTRGLTRGRLSFKIASLTVNDSILIECSSPSQQLHTLAQVTNASKIESIAHMQWRCERLAMRDMSNPELQSLALRITRIEDKPPT